MEINENQKPSPAPFGNDFEKPSDFQLESFVREKTKKILLMMNLLDLMRSKRSAFKAGY